MNYEAVRVAMEAQGWSLHHYSGDRTSATFCKDFTGTTLNAMVFINAGRWACHLSYLPGKQMLLQVVTTGSISWPHPHWDTLVNRLLRYARACDAADL